MNADATNTHAHTHTTMTNITQCKSHTTHHIVLHGENYSQCPAYAYTALTTTTHTTYHAHRTLHKMTTTYVHTTTSTQCKLKNTCSPVLYACISKCLVGRGKPPPVQVAMGSGGMVASHVCTLINALDGTGKNQQRKLQVIPTASAS